MKNTWLRRHFPSSRLTGSLTPSGHKIGNRRLRLIWRLTRMLGLGGILVNDPELGTTAIAVTLPTEHNVTHAIVARGINSLDMQARKALRKTPPSAIH